MEEWLQKHDEIFSDRAESMLARLMAQRGDLAVEIARAAVVYRSQDGEDVARFGDENS